MSKIEAGKTVFKYTDFSILDFLFRNLTLYFILKYMKKSRLLQFKKKTSCTSG